MQPVSDPEYIDNPERLRAFTAEIAGASWLALDTEFLREDTYFSILCLIQIATADRIALIDVCALKDISPLFPLLASPGCVKVMHAASQDLEVLYQSGAPPLANLFDTQVAAALLGHPDQIGYGNLVSALLGVQLNKDAQRTDWTRRPLSPQQLSYAADDVRHLDALHQTLGAALDQRGRRDWLQSEVQRLTNPARYQADPDSAWLRLKGLARLPPHAQAVARALAVWREKTAITSNRPRKWILADDLLYSLAQKQPQDASALASTGLPPSTQRKHGETLLALIAQVRPDESPAIVDEPELTGTERQTLKAMTAEVESVAKAEQIAQSLLGTRAELLRVLRRDPSASPLQGWRKSVIGERLLQQL